MSHLLQLLLILAAIVVLAKLAGAASVRLGQPAVFGEIAMGLILGPTVLNMLHWDIFARFDPTASGPVTDLLNAAKQSGLLQGAPGSLYLEGFIKDLAELGVILLMFVAGMETDLGEMRRVGKTASWAAVGGVVLPFFTGAAAATYFGLPLYWEGVFIGTILTATSVSISAQTLMELKALRSREGTTIMGAAVIDDVLGIIVLGLVTALSASRAAEAAGSGAGEIVKIVIWMALYFVVFWFLGRRYFERWCDWVRKVPASYSLLAFVLVVTFLYAWAAEFFAHLAAITGSYMAGVLFAQTRYKEEIDHHIHPLTYSFFVPIFFVSIGLEANGRELGQEIGFLVAILVVAIVTKVVGCYMGSRATGFNHMESLRVGIGMVSRGEVGLIVAGVGLSHGIIGKDIFSVMVIMVLVTTMVTPLLLRYVFPRIEEMPALVFESIGDLEVAEKGREESEQKAGGPHL